MDTSTRVSPDACPRNGQIGRKVSSLTVESQVRREILDALPQREGFRFCAVEDCPVVYYHAGDSTCITVEQVRFPVFQKSANPRQPVCYCFSHSVVEITEQVRATGTSTVPADIKEQCAKGLDACERNNPQGSCCLGNVQKVVKAAQASLVVSPNSEDVIEAACGGCCAPAETTPRANLSRKPSRAGWFGLGAVFSAVLASACCWLPLVLIAFGASAAGVAGFFEQWRPLFLAIAAVLLGVGFYMAYFREKCASGSACASPRRGIQQFNRVMLWLAAAFTLAFAAFPKYAGHFIGGDTPATTLSEVPGTTFMLNIQGMTCEACADDLHNALRRVPGVRVVEVSCQTKTARLVTDPPGTFEVHTAVLSAIHASGYEATVASE